MLHHFEKTPLTVDGCYTYKAIRVQTTGGPEEHGDMIQYFDCSKNLTYPAMQQVNVSLSKKNVIRGIHVSAFPKVVFCPVGKIYDVVVDCRPNSPTFKKWCGAWLDKDTHIFVPAFCAHGVFAAEEDSALCYYQMGTFWNHLDYPVSSRDPQLGVVWPAPINADEYIISEKDKTSLPLSDKLIETIRSRITDPITDYHTLTNTDIIVCTPNEQTALPFFAGISQLGLKGHHTMLSSLQRDSLNATVKSLRPKYGIIYLLDNKKGKNSTSLFTEVMNIIHIATIYADHLVIILGCRFENLDVIENFVREEHANDVLLLEGQCILQKGMEKKELAEKLASFQKEFLSSPTYTDLDAMGPQIAKMVVDKQAGVYPFVAKGELNLNMIEDVCKEAGIKLNVPIKKAKIDVPFEIPNVVDSFSNVIKGSV